MDVPRDLARVAVAPILASCVLANIVGLPPGEPPAPPATGIGAQP
jgi:hypothetical protein